MRPFVLQNQDMVSIERRAHIPDDVFNRAKNAISLADLLSDCGRRASQGLIGRCLTPFSPRKR